MLNSPSGGIGLIVVTSCVVALAFCRQMRHAPTVLPGSRTRSRAAGRPAAADHPGQSRGGAAASFYLLGSGNINNSGSLPASAWLHNVGDLDGDDRPDYRIDAPGKAREAGAIPARNGCPSTLDTPHPPLVIVITHEREDRDGDGKFDVFEDINHNGVLDPGRTVTGTDD